MLPPVCATVAGADFDTDTSEVAATPAWVVVALELSLAVLSLGVAVIEAVLLIVSVPVVVLAGTETTIVTVADDEPAARVPRLQLTVAGSEERRVGKEEESSVTPAGRVKVTVTAVAAGLPVCEAVIW